MQQTKNFLPLNSLVRASDPLEKKVETYHDELSGYKIDYPLKWKIESNYLNEISIVDKNEKTKKILTINSKKFNSLDELNSAFGFDKLNKVTINVTEAYELPPLELTDTSCAARRIGIYKNGLFFTIQRVPDSCMYDDKEVNAIISSFDISNVKTQSEVEEFLFSADHKWEDGLRYSATKIINNDLTSTIKKDFPMVNDISFESKNKNKAYFYICRETFSGCSNQLLNYLDREKSRYHNTQFEFGRNELQSKDKIFLAQTKDFKTVNTLNLETGKEQVFQLIKSNSESLVAKCVTINYGEAGDSIEEELDLMFLENNMMKVGVYKKEDEYCNNKEKRFEKIRDEIVDLTK